MSAPLLPTASSTGSSRYLLVGCGALLTAGVVLAATPVTAAHVQAPATTAAQQVGRLAAPARSASARQVGTPVAMASAATPSTIVAQVPAQSTASGMWLSVSALAMGAFAAAVTFMKRAERTVSASCSRCGSVGHSWLQCAGGCSRCGAADHNAMQCAQADARCTSCGSMDHTWAACATMGEVLEQQKQQMDQVALALKAEQASVKNMTPGQVILELQRGNARFWSGMPERPELTVMERRALIIAQAPTVCVLSCADSRVPVELLFDQGLGRIFVVRVAGNILDATAMGSIEFSVKYLGVKVVLVMGHEGCGAVKGAMSMTEEELDAQPAFLQSVLRSIKGNLNLNQLKRMRDSRAQDREAIITNATSQVKKLQENKIIAERVENGSVMVCAAFYEITSGMVDFFSLDKNGLVTDI